MEVQATNSKDIRRKRIQRILNKWQFNPHASSLVDNLTVLDALSNSTHTLCIRICVKSTLLAPTCSHTQQYVLCSSRRCNKQGQTKTTCHGYSHPPSLSTYDNLYNAQYWLRLVETHGIFRGAIEVGSSASCSRPRPVQNAQPQNMLSSLRWELRITKNPTPWSSRNGFYFFDENNLFVNNPRTENMFSRWGSCAKPSGESRHRD